MLSWLTRKFNAVIPKHFCCGTVLLFIPLIIMGGKLAARLVMNLWNLIEPGGYRG